MVGTPEGAAKAQQTRIQKVTRYEKLTGLPVNCKVKIGKTPGGHFNGQPGVVDNHNAGEIGVTIKGQVYYYRPSEVIRTD